MKFKDRLKALGFEDYAAYLKSDHWKQFKAEYYKNHKKECFHCREKNNLNLHHLRYENLGSEFGNEKDLIPLCRKCHKEVHRLNKENKAPLCEAHLHLGNKKPPKKKNKKQQPHRKKKCRKKKKPKSDNRNNLDYQLRKLRELEKNIETLKLLGNTRYALENIKKKQNALNQQLAKVEKLRTIHSSSVEVMEQEESESLSHLWSI